MTSHNAARRIEVAASTSNLGPGFDFLGLALSLHLRVRLVGPAAGSEHEISVRQGEARTWPSSDDLFLTAVRAAQEASGGGPAWAFAVDSEIPIGRGFGSSGAAVAAGLLLGASLGPRPAEIAELHRIGVALEGHPDNVTASLFGGLTLCHPTARDGAPLVARVPLAPELGFVLAWNDTELATVQARRVLPGSVSFADAVENPRRLALLVEGLRSGQGELITAGAEDRLHVAHRLPLIPGAGAALEAARRSGAWLATVSGAGSGLVAIAPHARTKAVAQALRAALAESAREADSARAEVLQAVAHPPRVVS